MEIGFILGIISLILLITLSLVIIVAKFYKKVDQGQALIVNRLNVEPLVTFTGTVVYPIIHRAEVIDIRIKMIQIDLKGKNALICKDNVQIDTVVKFYVRVNKSTEDIIRVASAVGAANASDQTTLENLFFAKFSDALKTVGTNLNSEELFVERERFRDYVLEMIGTDLNGYVLEDCAIDYLEKTPTEHVESHFKPLKISNNFYEKAIVISFDELKGEFVVEPLDSVLKNQRDR